MKNYTITVNGNVYDVVVEYCVAFLDGIAHLLLQLEYLSCRAGLNLDAACAACGRRDHLLLQGDSEDSGERGQEESRSERSRRRGQCRDADRGAGDSGRSGRGRL